MIDEEKNIFLIDLDSITFRPKDKYNCLPTWSYAPCNIINKLLE